MTEGVSCPRLPALLPPPRPRGSEECSRDHQHHRTQFNNIYTLPPLEPPTDLWLHLPASTRHCNTGHTGSNDLGPRTCPRVSAVRVTPTPMEQLWVWGGGAARGLSPCRATVPVRRWDVGLHPGGSAPRRGRRLPRRPSSGSKTQDGERFKAAFHLRLRICSAQTHMTANLQSQEMLAWQPLTSDLSF